MRTRAMLLVLWNLLLAAGATLVKPRVYEILHVNSTCTSQTVRVRLELNRNFNGVVYAKGYPLEKHCRSFGTGETFIEISIDSSSCGVRLVSIDDEKFTFRIGLNVQTDKFLQQINDLEVSATCSLSFNDMVYPRQAIYNRQLSRTGRNKAGVGDGGNELASTIKTWMEIRGTSDSSSANKVSVGEQTVILIKSFLPAKMTVMQTAFREVQKFSASRTVFVSPLGHGGTFLHCHIYTENLAANVVDCYAYDGTRDVAQKLIDDNGCPLDETIMPSLELIRYEDEDFSGENEITWEAGTDAKNRSNRSGGKKDSIPRDKEKPAEKKTRDAVNLQVMGTIFSAFKFPDTSNLHLRCSLQICRKECLPVSCDASAGSPQERTGKSMKSNRNDSRAIEKIEVFNSVEVVAPGIDSDGFSANQDGADLRIKTIGNHFCLSASKMAFSFAILGAVFLCGVLAALWTVMRNHLRKANKADGSEQILVVRDSPMNFMESRSKMYHNWTYS